MKYGNEGDHDNMTKQLEGTKLTCWNKVYTDVCFNIILSLFKSKLEVNENSKELKWQVLSLDTFTNAGKKNHWNIIQKAIASHFW